MAIDVDKIIGIHNLPEDTGEYSPDAYIAIDKGNGNRRIPLSRLPGGSVPGSGKLRIKLGDGAATDTGFNADSSTDVTVTIPNATESSGGLMTPEDKAKIDNIPEDICYMVVRATKNASGYSVNHHYSEVSGMLNRGYGITLQVQESQGVWEYYELSNYTDGSDIVFFSVRDDYESLDTQTGETVLGYKLATLSQGDAFNIQLSERTRYMSI